MKHTSHRGNSERRRQEEEKGDWLDTVCHQTSDNVCPVPRELPAEAFACGGEQEDDTSMLRQVLQNVGRSFRVAYQQSSEDHSGEEKVDSENGCSAGRVQTPRGAKSEGNADTLDYVFEKMESWVCTIPPEQIHEGPAHVGIVKDNAMVEIEIGKEQDLEQANMHESTSVTTSKWKRSRMWMGISIAFLVAAGMLAVGAYILLRSM